MSEYVVESIKSEEDRTTKSGKPFKKYLLSLVDQGDQHFEVPFADFQNVNPQPGQTLEGFEIKDEGFGRELRKVGSGNGAKPRPGRSPEETKAIQRQHSQEMGCRATALEMQAGLFKPEQSGDLAVRIKKWTDFFEKDIGNG